MDWAHIVAFNVALLAAWIAPGPAMLVSIHETLRGGLRGGVAAGLGLAVISPLWTLAALLGLDTIFRVFPWAYGTFKIFGALYLMFIAIQIWRHARGPLPPLEDMTGRAFRRGVVVNLGNPKSILFAAAVLVVIFPPDLTVAQAALVSLNHFALEFTLYVGLAVIMSRGAIKQSYLAAKPSFDRVSACILGGLGLRLLLDRST